MRQTCSSTGLTSTTMLHLGALSPSFGVFLSGMVARAACVVKLVLMRVGGYLLVGYFAARCCHGVVSLAVNYQRAPVTIAMVLLGLVGGQAAGVAVSGAGGNGALFSVLWVTLCATHCALAANSRQVLKWLHPQTQAPTATGATAAATAATTATKDGSGEWRRSNWWRPLALHAFLTLALPLAAGLLPFYPLFCTP
mmetsp:Transcript_30088/g.64260  ORF Transcript_30088/g.64260 Transcript_30088/m.64260 type:complete len:196 (-) Transcript_30088:98-685(-)